MISAVACVPRGAARARPRADEVEPAEADQLRQDATDGADSMSNEESDDDEDSDAGEDAAVCGLLLLVESC